MAFLREFYLYSIPFSHPNWGWSPHWQLGEPLGEWTMSHPTLPRGQPCSFLWMGLADDAVKPQLVLGHASEAVLHLPLSPGMSTSFFQGQHNYARPKAKTAALDRPVFSVRSSLSNHPVGSCWVGGRASFCFVVGNASDPQPLSVEPSGFTPAGRMVKPASPPLGLETYQINKWIKCANHYPYVCVFHHRPIDFYMTDYVSSLYICMLCCWRNWNSYTWDNSVKIKTSRFCTQICALKKRVCMET